MTINKEFEIINEFGMHARPSASFVKIANQFESDIMVKYNELTANGKSILGLLSLAVGPGNKLQISAEGKDAKQAIEELGNLIAGGFNEY